MMRRSTVSMQDANRLKLVLVGCVSFLILLGCEEKDANKEVYKHEDFQKIHFFKQSVPASGERTVLQALVSGKLILSDNCLLINVDGENQTSYSPIWPGHFQLKFVSGTIQVEEGNDVVAVVGNKIQIGGGEIRQPEALGELSIVNTRQPFAECPSPYWLVGERL